MAAARTRSAAALPNLISSSMFCNYFALLYLVFLFLFREGFCTRIIYSKEDLIKIGFTCKTDITRGSNNTKGSPTRSPARLDLHGASLPTLGAEVNGGKDRRRSVDAGEELKSDW